MRLFRSIGIEKKEPKYKGHSESNNDQKSINHASVGPLIGNQLSSTVKKHIKISYLLAVQRRSNRAIGSVIVLLP